MRAGRERQLQFDDGAAYERFMGRWSRAAGAAFLDWLAPPVNLHWLDVGCGTGAFTQLILGACAPASVWAVDRSEAQICHACRTDGRATFSIADARALPFADSSFDIVVSALVINFIPDRASALSEMRRAVWQGGLVAGYVWDFAAERSPSWPLRRAMRQIGMAVPEVAGARLSGRDSLHASFEKAGFERTLTRSIDVVVRYSSFDEFWNAQMPSYSPVTHAIASMTRGERARLIEAVRDLLSPCPGGEIEYAARSNAIKARVAVC